MSDILVLDASALLCLIHREQGWETVRTALPGSRIGAVNLGEVVARLSERGMTPEAIDSALGLLDLRVVAFDAEQARASGLLRQATRSAGLSLGDRACLVLAARLGATALTADRAWRGVEVGVKIQLIR
ncbi:MAG TPA: type II toxin-antitoxin system VapC family toxin [Caulobacteraceae bacterium]|nr:type II toxin-antitoxin system VapC family toxin [Caulobacteraceae bacterium]